MGRGEDQRPSSGRHGASFWQEESKSFGVKMMQKMGWAQGQGLGKNKNGTTEFVRTTKKKDNAGIGATGATRDEAFMATNAMYNNLLKRLNEQNAETNGNSEVNMDADADRGVNMGAKVDQFIAGKNLYSKFKKAKDLSTYSQENLAEILGTKARSSPTPSKQARSPSPSDSSIVVKSSGTSISDYFNKKMQEKGNNKAPTRFQVASGQGFSEAFQTSYYETMMGMAVTGRGGLGFARSHEAVDDEYSERKVTRDPSAYPPAASPSRNLPSPSTDTSDNVEDAPPTEKELRKQKKAERKRRDQEEAEAIKAAEERKERKRARREERRRLAEAQQAAQPEAEEAVSEEVRDRKRKKRRQEEPDDLEIIVDGETSDNQSKPPVEEQVSSEPVQSAEERKKRKREKRARRAQEQLNDAETPPAETTKAERKKKKKRKSLEADD